jgi:hypothetical protein
MAGSNRTGTSGNHTSISSPTSSSSRHNNYQGSHSSHISFVSSPSSRCKDHQGCMQLQRQSTLVSTPQAADP